MSFPFLYEGIVVTESSEDPAGLDRVRIRVFKVHGYQMPEELLPWALVNSFGGGCPDAGSADKYIKGAGVWVMFEEGDPSMPVVMGGLVKRPTQNQKYGSDDWTAESGSTTNVPQEAKTPGVRTVFKSPKGATLYYDETDEAEKLILVDRAGQMVEMVSPVLDVENENNGARRGTGTVDNDGQLDYAQMSGPSYIRMRDLGGNAFLLWAEDQEEKVEIENGAFDNKYVMDKDGARWDILGGMDDGGITITVDSTGVKVNGQYLATAAVVDWIKAFETKFTISTKPGTRAPLFPAALLQFNSQKEASVSEDGMKTRLPT